MNGGGQTPELAVLARAKAINDAHKTHAFMHLSASPSSVKKTGSPGLTTTRTAPEAVRNVPSK